MNTNPQIASPRGISGEGSAAIAGAVGSAFLLAKKLLGPKPAKIAGILDGKGWEPPAITAVVP